MEHNQQNNKMRQVPLKDVDIRDDFWSRRIELVREVVIPYQWEALNDRVEGAEKSGAVANFKIAAGLAEGDFYGMVFQDSDVAKWLEAVAYSLAKHPDPGLEATADELIKVIAAAQAEDGYLNTYYLLKEPGARWTNLAECHELYCAGHMIEAGAAYFEATGKRKLLDAVCRYADYIDGVFGAEPGKLQGYDGHQEIELALVRLYETTQNERYLKLSEFFLNERGKRPHFFERQLRERGGRQHFSPEGTPLDFAYHQSHLPVREQDRATGHAVRMVYMLTGMAGTAAITGDEGLKQACLRLWDSIVSRQMYITGGIGSMAQGEAFSADFDLPNDMAYAETCASVGLIFFAHRMLLLYPESRFADVMERALYNTVLAGMSGDGKHFFYVNPLEVDPKLCGGSNKNYNHVKPVRQEWFGCACCPPNVARLLASLGRYIYTVKDNTVYTHLYIGGESRIDVRGNAVKIAQQSNYPWDGDILLSIDTEQPQEFELALRIPDWSVEFDVSLNGEKLAPAQTEVDSGYLKIRRVWSNSDQLRLLLSMPVQRVYSDPRVRANAGKTAIQRGPLVYCLEEADNGANLHQLLLPADREIALERRADGTLALKAEAVRRTGRPDARSGLYSYGRQGLYAEEKATVTMIPYYAWANRGEGEMAVWIREGC